MRIHPSLTEHIPTFLLGKEETIRVSKGMVDKRRRQKENEEKKGGEKRTIKREL